ncbi:Sodium/hydrogen exchanger family-domain-containing protein [Flagelloscypha sp. PMI_526]|nr:Sodium/hydrogen exchanger family-domain-containing protein [Flagelloscypha sp. PMI_526]
MGQLTDQVFSLVARAAAEQGGVISGDDPTKYSAANPIRLWVIQVIIIMAVIQLLAFIGKRIRQPRVIAEVIGGIILGPTVMGRIPHFKAKIFPEEAMGPLTLSANIGLILFLFLVGLEIDTRLFKRNAKISSAVSIAGLIIPLGLGAALGVGVYREFVEPVNPNPSPIGITAFPVLCRILTECRLLDTPVGAIVLSAGIGNDVVGWILLALTVALVNASDGLTALYVLLASAGYVIFLLFPGRWAFRWLCVKTGSLEQGSPTPFMMTLTIMLVFASAFFTDIIGVHAIFGGFLAGVIVPHENGFAISIVEKIEDLVSILLMPLYFTLSGLKTDFGYLNTGTIWGYTVLTCVVAFVAKFGACAGVAASFRLNWRESGAIGSLMACKGLVELIVLNIGLNAKILDTRTFSMFVLHAVVLTFITTPLTLAFYPEEHRKHSSLLKTGDDLEALPELPKTNEGDVKTRFAVVLDKIEQLPAAMTVSQLLQPASSLSPTFVLVTLSALRLVELSNRTSAVFKGTDTDSLLLNDPLVSIFRTFGSIHRLAVKAALSVVPYDQFAEAVAEHAKSNASDMIILPWARGAVSIQDDSEAGAKNPFDGVFAKGIKAEDQTSSVVYSEYIRKVFLRSPCDVGLFQQKHLILPFIGGPDDRLALQFVCQIIMSNPKVTATVVRISKAEKEAEDDESITNEKPHLTVAGAGADTVYGAHNTQTRLASDTADNVEWSKYSTAKANPRITFSEATSPTPLEYALGLLTPSSILVTGRSRRMPAESLSMELKLLLAKSVSRTLGDVGAGVVALGGESVGGLLIVQAAVTA